MEFQDLNPLLHNELRLKLMVALDTLDDADFVYLKEMTKSSAGNVSVQISKLEEAGYIKVHRSGSGRGSHTICRITPAGTRALKAYQNALMSYFTPDAGSSPA